MLRFIATYDALSAIDQRRLPLWQVYAAAAAHHFMGEWKLAPDRETHMRMEALATIHEAETLLIG